MPAVSVATLLRRLASSVPERSAGPVAPRLPETLITIQIRPPSPVLTPPGVTLRLQGTIETFHKKLEPERTRRCARWRLRGASHRLSPFYTGTLWEKLGQNGQDTDSNASLAHGWATAPVSAFSSYLLGIQPTGPGYSTWSIAPQPATLNWAQGQVPTPSANPVVSRWQAGSNASSFQLTMSAPAGTAGTVAVPELGASRVIAEDGQIVWAGGAPVGSVSATEASGSVVFANVSGAHTFAWVASPTSADVCTLTKEYVDGSANYQKLTPVQQKVVDGLVTAACTFLTEIGPNVLPKQKQAFIQAYDNSVQALTKQGWLTQPQSTTLQNLASGL